MSLQYAILGVLEARPMTGYELTRFFESSARWVWSAPQSQIYPLLKRLHQEGLIDAEEQTRGERMRRVRYSLTEEGLRDLQGWLRRPLEEAGPRDPHLLQALFFDLIPAEDADRVLAAAIDDLRERAEQWNAHRMRLLAQDTPLLRERLARRDPADYERIAALKAHVFGHLVETAEARIAWAEQARRILAGETMPSASGAASSR